MSNPLSTIHVLIMLPLTPGLHLRHRLRYHLQFISVVEESYVGQRLRCTKLTRGSLDLSLSRALALTLSTRSSIYDYNSNYLPSISFMK